MELNMLTRIKRVNGYAAHARFNAELAEDYLGWIPRQADIETPFAYSPTWGVRDWNGRAVVVCETGQRRYDVFEVPRAMITDEQTAERTALAAMRPR